MTNLPTVSMQLLQLLRNENHKH